MQNPPARIAQLDFLKFSKKKKFFPPFPESIPPLLVVLFLIPFKLYTLSMKVSLLLKYITNERMGNAICLAYSLMQCSIIDIWIKEELILKYLSTLGEKEENNHYEPEF